MGGNVWEWVQDEYHSDYNGAPSDGSGWCDGDCPVNASDPNYDTSDNTRRVVRGGDSAGDEFALRVASRFNYVPLIQLISFGGRLAKSVP